MLDCGKAHFVDWMKLPWIWQMCTRSRKWEIPAFANVNSCNALHWGIRLSANAGGANTFIFMTRLPSACWPSWKEETRWNLFYLLCQVQAGFLFSSWPPSWKEETRWKLNLSLSPWPRCQLHADHWPIEEKETSWKPDIFFFTTWPPSANLVNLKRGNHKKIKSNFFTTWLASAIRANLKWGNRNIFKTWLPTWKEWKQKTETRLIFMASLLSWFFVVARIKVLNGVHTELNHIVFLDLELKQTSKHI